jgi:Spy/CpxP family protein refolding chaperone
MNLKMNGWKHLIAVSGLMMVVSVPTLAQTPPAPNTAAPQAGRQRGGRQTGISSLPVEAIDTIVTLNAEQKTKITTIQDKLKEDSKAANGDRQKMGELRTQANTDLKAVLTPSQTKSLDAALPALTMLNQSRVVPYGALAEVKLTKDQMGKIADIAKAEQEKLKGVTGADRRTKMQEVNADFKTQVDPILTKEQKDILAKYEAAHPRRNRAAGNANGNA